MALQSASSMICRQTRLLGATGAVISHEQQEAPGSLCPSSHFVLARSLRGPLGLNFFWVLQFPLLASVRHSAIALLPAAFATSPPLIIKYNKNH